uniref:SDR family NAD(P)-dependent oxidoreductase n=1 Tax=Rugamonas sp. TaxID=1926287 RepID=UPI0025D2C284
MNVFITGASAGFGAAMARTFVANGHTVLISARREERLQALAAELGEAARVVVLDVTDRASIQAALDGLPPAWQRIDVLINNAGLALGTTPAHESSLDDWDTMIATNCSGLVAMTRAILPGMVARGSGTVINLGSVAGTYPYPGGNVYAGTKAFVHQLSLGMRADLLGKKVRVTSIEPGMVETDFSLVRFKGDEAKARAVYQDFQ